jgi:hypothetical protein
LSICSASFYSYLLFSYFLIFCCQPYFHWGWNLFCQVQWFLQVIQTSRKC